ncbi:MAG: hypothetical protein IJ092_08735 [Atopobiaceae bacterium]|nr:hypothetical protein [Atopobiaceae bacterium]
MGHKERMERMRRWLYDDGLDVTFRGALTIALAGCAVCWVLLALMMRGA